MFIRCLNYKMLNVHIYIYICTHAPICPCSDHTRTRTHTDTHMYNYIYIHVYTEMYVCMYICTYVCIYVCICVMYCNTCTCVFIVLYAVDMYSWIFVYLWIRIWWFGAWGFDEELRC